MKCVHMYNGRRGGDESGPETWSTSTLVAAETRGTLVLYIATACTPYVPCKYQKSTLHPHSLPM